MCEFKVNHALYVNKTKENMEKLFLSGIFPPLSNVSMKNLQNTFLVSTSGDRYPRGNCFVSVEQQEFITYLEVSIPNF